MNNHSLTYSSIAMLAALVIAITMFPANMEPSYAQPTFDAPSGPSSSPDTGSPTETGAGVADDGENFQQFMQCLFGTGASEEDITSALDGTGESTPTEQEIRDCFTPLYNTGRLQVLQLRLAVLRLVRLTMQVKTKERVAPTVKRQKMKANLKIS